MAPMNRSHVHATKPVIVKSLAGECTPDGLPISSLTVRARGTKDRHSKVRTAKGLRDRRVRLSASTAIEFFEVQARLGFDQPSKALDWLIRHARAAIDELAPLEPIFIQNGSEEARTRDCIGQVAKASQGIDAVHHEIPKAHKEHQLSSNSCFGGSDLLAPSRAQNRTSETNSKSDGICQVMAPTLTKFSTSCAHVPDDSLVLCESKQSITQHPSSSTLISSGTNCRQYMNSNSMQESCCSLHSSCNPYSPLILHDFSQQLSHGTPVPGDQCESTYYPTAISPRGTLLSIASDGFTSFSILHSQGTHNSEPYTWMDLHESVHLNKFLMPQHLLESGFSTSS